MDGGSQHSNFYHLGKHIKMSVHSLHDSGSKCHCCHAPRVYFHGISQVMAFPVYGIEQLSGAKRNRRAGVHIHGPLSTSSEFEVAVNFTNHNAGLVIEFKDNDSKHLRFSSDPLSLCWLSEFPNEHEFLYIQARNP